MGARVRFLLCASVLCLLPIALAWADVRDEATRLVVRSRRTTLVLDKQAKGAIASLTDNATGLEFVARDKRSVLFRLALSKAGDTSGKLTWLSSQDAAAVACTVERRDGRQVARLRFEKLGGQDVWAECTVAADPADGMLLWGFRAGGTAPLVVEEVTYPVVALRAPLGGDSEAFVAGITKGGVYGRPSQWRVGKTIAANQPGSLAAQFACYYNSRAGLYSATRDAKGYPKGMRCRRTKQGLELSWHRYAFHRLGKPFALGYEAALTTFGGRDKDAPPDWRDAADLYKAWAVRQSWCARTLAQRTDLPAWLREGPAMVRFTRSWLAHPERIEAWLRDYWRKQFPRAPLIVAFWGWEHVSSWVSPKYFPPYPSEEGMARIVKAVRGVGGHPFFWPSGYQWALTFGKRADGSFEHDDRADFEKTARPHTVTRRDGSPYVRNYRWLAGGANATLCRGDAWTRQWLNDIAIGLTKRGADLVQIDQVVGAGLPGGGRCYSTAHGHPPGPGLWDTLAFGEQLRSMHAACKALNPDIVLGFEEPQELFIHQIGIQDYRDYQVVLRPRTPRHAAASVFGYLYHEFVPCFQSNPRAGNARMMAHCIVTGQVPHLAPHWPLAPSPALVNGRFEEWDADVPDGWSHVKGYRGRVFAGVPHRDDGIKHSGPASLRLESAKKGDIGQVSQNVPIGDHALRVGGTYRLSLWFRATTLAKGSRIVLGAFDPGWKAKEVWGIPLALTEQWRRGEVTFTIPAGAVRLRIMLNAIGPSTVWIDDLALEEATADGTFRRALRKGLPAQHELQRAWVRLFYGEGRPYLLLGRTLRPPPLRIEGDAAPDAPPAILHNAFRAPDGSEAVVAVNAAAEPRRALLTWRGKDRRLSFVPHELKLIKD